MASKQNDNSDRVMIPANIAAWCNGDFANHPERASKEGRKGGQSLGSGGGSAEERGRSGGSQQGSSGNYANDSE